jgi:hypothetical protein
MRFSNYKFRCHSIGKFKCSPKSLTKKQLETLDNYSVRDNSKEKPLTEAQKKDFIALQYKFNESQVYKLSETQKKDLRKIVFQQNYGRRFAGSNKFFDKGILTEKEGRDMLSYLINEPLIKDDEQKENDWVLGRRDVKHDGFIIDLKNAWNLESYANIVDDAENEKEGYLDQMDSYMDLWGLKTSLICHTLVDTPIHLLEHEIRSIFYNMRYYEELSNELTNDGINAVKSVVYNHTFTEKSLQDVVNYSLRIHSDVFFEFNAKMFEDFKPIPIEDRVHIIQHDFQKERIEQRNKSIEISRKYMNTVEIKNNVKFNIV